jgi:carbonic anhydrase
VKATCDFVSKGLDPVEATGLTNLGSITEPISEAVKMETRTTGVRDSSNHDFVDQVATIHVRNTLRWIEEHSPVLRSMIMNGEIGIVGAMYDVSTGKVEFMDGVGAAGVQGSSGSAKARA